MHSRGSPSALPQSQPPSSSSRSGRGDDRLAPPAARGAGEGRRVMQKPATAAPVPPDRQLERISDIEYWWSGIHGAGADSSRRPSEPRLFAAFRRVLLAMPDDDFERFMELSPTVIFQPGVEGTVYSYWLPIIPGADHVVLRVIYICPDLRKWSDARIVRLVAHEAAHLVLGHADAGSY